MKWDDTNTALVLKLEGEGKTLVQIAAIMGITKGSVAGKLNRIRGYKRDHTDKHSAWDRAAPVLVRPYEPPPPLRPRGPVTLFQLTSKTCRWPLGDGPAVLFCGDVPRDGNVYCPKHCGMAYNPLASRKPPPADLRSDHGKKAQGDH